MIFYFSLYSYESFEFRIKKVSTNFQIPETKKFFEFWKFRSFDVLSNPFLIKSIRNSIEGTILTSCYYTDKHFFTLMCLCIPALFLTEIKERHIIISCLYLVLRHCRWNFCKIDVFSDNISHWIMRFFHLNWFALFLNFFLR